LRAIICAALLFATFAARSAAEILSVHDVMRRVAAYVDAYGAKAQIVVATEHYTQMARRSGGGAASRTMPILPPAGPTMRRILADFALVRVETLRGWQGFRDVVEVDGERLPDRDGRLVKLLTESGGRYDEARRLSDESARFNIGPILRNFNVPTTALFFFTTDNLARFRFSAKRVDAGGIWEVAFRETERPTLIRTPAGQSVPSEGTLWVNPSDGTIVRTLLQVEGFAGGPRRSRGTGRVDVTYQRVAVLDMWLPASMDEDFEATRGDVRDTITGRALYSNYRQFTTTVRIK
jgi:hypothetical protein